MLNKRILIGSTLLACVLLLTGCHLWPRQGKAEKPKDIRPTPTEQTKAKLLKKIDRKFQDSDAHYQLGQIYQAEGLWAKAEHQYNLTLTFDPVHRKAQAARITVLQAMNNQSQAQTSAEFYINQASGSAAASLRLALAFQQQGLDDYTMTCYEQALNLAPESAKIHRQIGFYYLSREQTDKAKEYLLRSFQLDPHQPDVAGELGRLGVTVEIPRKSRKNTEKLDKIIEDSQQQARH